MGFMSQLHFQIYSEPRRDSECYREEENDPEALSGEVQREARRSEVKEQELLAKRRCIRATEILKGTKSEGLPESA